MAAEDTLFQLQRFFEGRPVGEKCAGTSGYPRERAENISTARGRRGDGRRSTQNVRLSAVHACAHGSGNIPSDENIRTYLSENPPMYE